MTRLLTFYNHLNNMKPSLDELFGKTPQANQSKPSLNDIFSGSTPVMASKPIEQEPTFLSNLKSSFTEGLSKIKSGFQTTQKGAVNKDLTQGATEQVRGALGMASGAISSAFSPLTATVQTGLQKTGLDKPINSVVTGLSDKIANIPSLQKFAMENPNAEEVISDLINVVGSAYSPQTAKGISKVTQPVAGEILQTAGQALQSGTDDAISSARLTAVQKLLQPVENKASRLDAVSRTQEKGILGSKVVEPTAREIDMVSDIVEIPNVNPKGTFQSNFNATKEYNFELAKQLENEIASNNFLIPRKETIARLNKAVATLEESPVIVGDAQKTAQRLIDGAKKFINESDGTASGVLEARKKYDKWVVSQKPKAYDANTENAFTIANREVRSTLNDILAEKAPNVDVKGSLQKQSRIYDALDILQEKAASEGKNKITRAFNRIGETIGTKNKGIQTLVSLGLIGGAGAAATMALPATLIGSAGYLLYRGGKWVVSPQVRKAIGEILETSGNKLNPADKKILEQLSGKSIPNKQGGFINLNNIKESLNTKVNLPKDETFLNAVKNTDGAEITKDGLKLKALRFQTEEQGGMTSVRTGVFYLPSEKSAGAKFYKGSNGYGGSEKMTGDIVVQKPLFVKGATGGKAPEIAYDTLNGKGAYQNMRSDVLDNVVGYNLKRYEIEENLQALLEKYNKIDSAEAYDMAYNIIENSKSSNLLPYAVQENIVANAVRNSGYDSVLGYSVKKDGSKVLSELFDVREISYPEASNMAGEISSEFIK